MKRQEVKAKELGVTIDLYPNNKEEKIRINP